MKNGEKGNRGKDDSAKEAIRKKRFGKKKGQNNRCDRELQLSDQHRKVNF